MTVPDPFAARAALDAARVVFDPLLSAGAPVDVPHALRPLMGAAAQAVVAVLHAVTGRTDLNGQALIGEARRLGRLSLEDAYPLVALLAWVERSPDADERRTPDQPTPEQRLAGDAFRALGHAVSGLDPGPAAHAPPRAFGVPPVVAGPLGERPAQPGPRFDDVRMLEEIAAPAQGRSFFRSSGFLIATVGVVLLGAAGVWAARRPRADSIDFAAGLAAYQRGAPEVARIAFARAARANRSDERPLIFLGRLAREEGNLVSARRFLDAAIRIAPASAVANRELASVLLADGNAEVARRFYVRALQIDPNDRLAQGFLGCALFRLGRPEEAVRWTDRAGTGDWTACVTVPASPASASSSPPARQ